MRLPQSKEISTQLCRCNPRIPINQFDIHFYLDQMGLRVKFIGPVNFRETQLESKRIEKDIQENLRIEKENQRIQDSVYHFRMHTYLH